jgi:ABC-type sugar transport system substrate-binding protein
MKNCIQMRNHKNFTSICLYFFALMSLLVSTLNSSVAADNAATLKPSGNTSHVVFFVNSTPDSPFWLSQVNYATAVAQALDMQLSVVYIPNKYIDRFGVFDFISNYLQKSPKVPDLIVSALWLGAEEKLLMLMDQQKIPLISINAHLTDRHLAVLGKPRGRFPLWLGHVSADDVKVGNLMAEYLIQDITASRNGEAEQAINLFAFSGLAFTSASQQREQGLQSAVNTHKNVHLFNVVHANWDKDLAYTMMPIILKRHDDIDGYWIASDIMTFGVLQGLKELGNPSSAILASVDWSPAMVDFIESGDVRVSFGGHFIEAGIAMTLYKDYVNVADFADLTGTLIYVEMSKLEKANVKTLGAFLKKPKWESQVLRRNSRFYNPQFTRYSFNAADIILSHNTDASAQFMSNN